MHDVTKRIHALQDSIAAGAARLVDLHARTDPATGRIGPEPAEAPAASVPAPETPAHAPGSFDGGARTGAYDAPTLPQRIAAAEASGDRGLAMHLKAQQFVEVARRQRASNPETT